MGSISRMLFGVMRFAGQKAAGSMAACFFLWFSAVCACAAVPAAAPADAVPDLTPMQQSRLERGLLRDDIEAVKQLILQVGPDEAMKPWQTELAARLAAAQRLAALRALEAHGWKFGEGVMRGALLSMHAETILYAANATHRPFEELCFDLRTSDYAEKIIETMKWSNDEEWSGYLRAGIAKIPLCPERKKYQREDDASNLEEVAGQLMCDPLAATGPWAATIARRFADLRKQGLRYSPVSESMREMLQGCSGEGFVRKLRDKNGKISTQLPYNDSAFPAAKRPLAVSMELTGLSFDDDPIPAPSTDKQWLAGEYEGKFEPEDKMRRRDSPKTGGVLRLGPDGTFHWNAMGYEWPMQARGRWSVLNSTDGESAVVLRSGNEAAASFKIVKIEKYAEDSSLPRPVMITVMGRHTGNKFDFDLYAFDDKQVLFVRRFEINRPMDHVFERAPTKFALWQNSMPSSVNARSALEVDLPSMKNVRSLELDLELQGSGGWVPYVNYLPFSASTPGRIGVGTEFYVRRNAGTAQ